jgi:hypothetical protein
MHARTSKPSVVGCADDDGGGGDEAEKEEEKEGDEDGGEDDLHLLHLDVAGALVLLGLVLDLGVLLRLEARRQGQVEAVHDQVGPVGHVHEDVHDAPHEREDARAADHAVLALGVLFVLSVVSCE